MAGHLAWRQGLAIVATFVIGTVLLSPALVRAEPGGCSEHRVPVALTKDGPTDHFIWGELCGAGGAAGPTVQLLVHGYSMTHTYWDFPYDPERYSYTRFMADAGYATFNIDRLGTGKSSWPLGTEVSFDSHVFTLHQVIAALRRGAVGGTVFERVVLVGHSYGAAIAEALAGIHPGDADGVVATGWLHGSSPSVVANFIARQVPTQIEERFRNRPPGYVTPARGASADVFYSPEQTDPAILPYSETLRDTGTVGDHGTSARTPGARLDPQVTQRIRVPLLFVVGEKDAFFCGNDVPACPDAEAVLNRERPYFRSAGILAAYVQQGAGHNITEQLDAHDGYRAVEQFLRHLSGPAPLSDPAPRRRPPVPG